jgi:uncharacterized protein
MDELSQYPVQLFRLGDRQFVEADLSHVGQSHLDFAGVVEVLSCCYRARVYRMASLELIREIASKIVEQFKPQRIILFGSFARGEETENSDIDLLVLIDTQERRGKRSAPILRFLAEQYEEPIDVVVRSPQSLEDWKDVPDSFAQQILREGITLYEES